MTARVTSGRLTCWTRVLTAYELAGPDFREHGIWGGDAHDRIRVPPFDAVELELATLWAPIG